MKIKVSVNQEQIDKLYIERQKDIERLIALGLPGCLAMGCIPGSIPGKLRPADVYHRKLVESLLKVLSETSLN